jgi:hypothetical protein
MRWTPFTPTLWIEIAAVIAPGILGWRTHGWVGSWIAGVATPRWSS